MNHDETMELTATVAEGGSEEEVATTAESMPDVDASLLAEAEGVRAVYPAFDLTAELAHPVMGAILRGEATPTLRQLYEAVHIEDITEGRIASAVEARLHTAVEAAVSEAVTAAVRECEERLLGHIRARGQRPAENGVRSASGIRMHPAVGRLTRRERAMLAKRAEDGETIKLS